MRYGKNNQRYSGVFKSRQQAIEDGDTRYVGKLCEHHPDDEGVRYTCDGKCVTCTYENARKHNYKLLKGNIDGVKRAEIMREDEQLKADISDPWDMDQED